MSQRSRIATTGDEVASFIEEQPRFQLAMINRDGSARILTDPNDVRYVGSQVVRRMMGLNDDTAIDSIAGETASKRYAYVIEPPGVVSWDRRKLT